jgi:NitT/TauT family transport system substrate-binding protein
MIVKPILACLASIVGATALHAADPPALRVGHFPNITHAQSLVARAMAREGKPWFEPRTGARIEWFTYNAGPSAMEAIFANAIDLTYVGPNPALNAYARSKGEEIRIIAGAANGGAALVVQSDSTLKTPIDFKGKRIATPQLGNTQDVAARAWLANAGLRITQTGGDALVLPTANPDQLSLFAQKKLDGVWTVEPWVSRLEREAGGKVLLEQPDAVTTVLVASAKALAQRRELVAKFAAAHRELTQWMGDNPAEAQRLVVAELKELTRSEVSPELVAAAWRRIIFTPDISRAAMEAFVVDAKKVGFLRDVPELDRLVVPLP